MSKKVGIILVNYKDYVNRFLEECRDTLRTQTYSKDLTNIYIVDNASSAESVTYIEKNYPEAIILKREDGNYSAANNAGIKQAIKDGCDYLVIANMDTSFDKDWLLEMIKTLESDDKIGLVQSKILLYPKDEEEKKHPKINSLGNIMHYLGFGFTSAYNEVDEGNERDIEIKGYASGCSFIIKKELIDKIGAYDEEYYMYHDDVEVSWKVKLAGYKIFLAAKSVVYHKYEFSRSVRMLYYMERNRYLAMFHFYKPLTLVLLMPAIVAMDLGMWLFSLLNGWTKTKFEILKYFLSLKNWQKILKKRKEISKLRIKSDKDIIDSFEGRVLFQEVANPVLNYIANPIFNLYWKVVKNIIIW